MGLLWRHHIPRGTEREESKGEVTMVTTSGGVAKIS